ncbi:hypothetical protein IR083_10045 [Dysgonomonas sp. GY75]|uniref:hypothetical protein n=1 Tax=Dysgonomonas sp. GY75 TaxID=2780419 RepID=UPI001883E3F5|nr:hypothetical protein [Dysgonomonas sp. GY75]MBF0649161.1 hypothetical protein [Dysgonomonas sp. GY75]
MEVDLFKLKQLYIEAGEIAALSVVKRLFPALDEIKFKEAAKIAGSERWLEHHIQEGNLTRIRHGTKKNSPFYYSRQEIVALKQAEAKMAKLK